MYLQIKELLALRRPQFVRTVSKWSLVLDSLLRLQYTRIIYTGLFWHNFAGSTSSSAPKKRAQK